MLYNRRNHSRGFFNCFMIRDPINSQRIRLNFTPNSFFSKDEECLFSDKAPINEPSISLVRIVQLIWLANETTAVLSVSSGFREKDDAVKCLKCLKIKFPNPEKSGRVVAHENVQFCNENCETVSSKLADKNSKCRIIFKTGYSYYACSCLQQDCPN